MKIYQAEIDAGLESLLSCSMGSVKYDVDITKTNVDLLDKLVALNKTVAEKKDFDLFPVDSLMVSVGWNKNYDVFLRSEVWGARATPEDKPLNIQHNELDIIGHIVANYVIDNAGNVIDSDTKFEDLPDVFHIIANSVVYTKWSDETRSKLVAEIVEQIKKDLAEDNKASAFWKVSMECLFSRFDYALIDSVGKETIIERSEASAFLTPLLKCYGGTGQFKEYKIGRVMRNICFSALGLVNKPANPDSVIFDGVLSFREESTSNINEIMETVMANDIDTSKELITELKSKVETLEANSASLADKLSKSEAAAKEHADKLIKIENENKILNDKLVAFETEKTDLSKKLADSEAKVISAEKSLAEIKASEIKAKRIAVFVDKGMNKEDAEKQVAKLEALDDATFDTVASLVNKVEPVVVTPVVTEPDAGAAAASVIDTAKPNDKPAVVLPNANDEGLEKVRAGLSEFCKVAVQTKNKKK